MTLTRDQNISEMPFTQHQKKCKNKSSPWLRFEEVGQIFVEHIACLSKSSVRSLEFVSIGVKANNGINRKGNIENLIRKTTPTPWPPRIGRKCLVLVMYLVHVDVEGSWRGHDVLWQHPNWWTCANQNLQARFKIPSNSTVHNSYKFRIQETVSCCCSRWAAPYSPPTANKSTEKKHTM